MSTIANSSTVDERWLRCRVDEGMFSDEYAVTYPTEGEPQISVFIPATKVKDVVDREGRVHVRLFSRNGQTIAVLPTEYGELVHVKPGDVSSS